MRLIMMNQCTRISTSKTNSCSTRVRFLVSAFFIVFSASSLLRAQDTDAGFVLSASNFLTLVKQYHPVAKQADLIPESAQARLLQARGGFDPKLFGDLENKTYKETEYYSLVNAGLKVPTWYGIEFKADYSYARGSFINPKESLPEQGLLAAGLSVPLGRGLWISGCSFGFPLVIRERTFLPRW